VTRGCGLFLTATNRSEKSAGQPITACRQNRDKPRHSINIALKFQALFLRLKEGDLALRLKIKQRAGLSAFVC
jgi:hypothetical protein